MFRTHRQRVPAMLVVACVGMMVYAVAGAAPDGRELAPAETTAPAAKSGSDGSTAPEDCKGSTTSTTEKGDSSTDTTRKSGSTTSTTEKDEKPSTTTTTDTRDSDPAPKADAADSDMTMNAAAKGDSGSSTDSGDRDGCKEPTTTTTRRSGDKEPTTTTTEKGGKGSTTSTTRRSGDKDGKGTTTTTDRRDRPTTTTTEKRDTVEPTTPSGGDPGSGGTDSGGSTDPGATPIEPQEAPPEEFASDPGPAAGPEEAAEDFGPEDGGPYDYEVMPEEESFDMEDGDEFALGAAPGEAEPILPAFGGFYPGSSAKAAVPASRPSRSRSSGRVQQLAAPPLVVSSPSAQASSAVAESTAVSRRLAGLHASASESAFPATVISTPKVFPMNRRDPMAAAALVLLVGVSRELFKVWRRRASDYWPA